MEVRLILADEELPQFADREEVWAIRACRLRLMKEQKQIVIGAVPDDRYSGGWHLFCFERKDFGCD